MLKILLIFFTLINENYCFNNLLNNNLLNNNIITKANDLNNNINKNICPTYLEKYTKYIEPERGEFIIKKISNIFPQMDVISHFVLHTNDVAINYILNIDFLSLDTKKQLALFLIHCTQLGDSTGSHILQFYSDLVKCLL